MAGNPGNRGFSFSPWAVVDLLLLLGGGAIALFAYREFKTDEGASKDPVAVELADLESGKPLPDKHVVIGRHLAMHTLGFYRFETQREFGAPKPKPTDRVENSYYPIISETHPFLRRLDALTRKYGSLDKVPKSEPLPELRRFAVLVKSRTYNTIGQIPKQMRYEHRVQGIVVSRASALSSEEQKLLRESMPDVDLDSVMVLAEGRRPTEGIGGLIVFGVCVALAGVGIFCIRLLLARRRAKRARPIAPVTDDELGPKF